MRWGWGTQPCGGHPHLVGCPLPQPEPLLSWEGFSWGKKTQSSLGASWFHRNAGCRPLLRTLVTGQLLPGLQTAQETVRTWQALAHVWGAGVSAHTRDTE